nr:Hpt domain-containing protein [Candidatus Dormibacteraeota bacterium]
MTSGLLALEAEPGNPAPLDGVFREAHTLKGGAGLVGLHKVSHLSHRLEDLLEELRLGNRVATPRLTDSLLKAVDGLARLIAGSLDGVEDAVEVETIEAALGAIDDPAAAPEPTLLAPEAPRPQSVPPAVAEAGVDVATVLAPDAVGRS